MDVQVVRNSLDSFDKAQSSMEKQRQEEKIILQKLEEKKDADRARKRQEAESSNNPVDKSAIMGKTVGLGEAIAMSVIAGILG